MEDRTSHRPCDDGLMARDVEADSWVATRYGQRPAITEPRFECGLALPVRALTDQHLVPGNGDSAQILDALGDPGKERLDVAWLVRRVRKQREVQVLREPVRLEEAFLDARPTLEDPARAPFIQRDAGQDPPEDVILLHHVGPQLPFAGAVEDVSLRDHGVRPSRPGSER